MMFSQHHHRQPQRGQPQHRYEGFQHLQELLHPKLRPASTSVLTVKDLIDYKKQQLFARIDAQTNGCDVYFPWSGQRWAFQLFKPAEKVKQYLTRVVLDTERRYAHVGGVHVHRNVYDGTARTDYVQLVRCATNILVFGDNVSGVGYGGSARVRDAPNAFGMPTGWSNALGKWTLHMEYRSIREARSSLAQREAQIQLAQRDIARREAQIQQTQRDMATREQKERQLKRIKKLLQ